jgi:hypothetical protein
VGPDLGLKEPAEVGVVLVGERRQHRVGGHLLELRRDDGTRGQAASL